MFTAEQYRTKAAEYSKMVKTARSPKEISEFQKLERTFAELADNEQWVTDHYDQILHAPQHGEVGANEQLAEAAGNQAAVQTGGRRLA